MRLRLIAIIVLVLLLLAGWGFHQRYEFVTEWVDEGPGPLALRDPLLAARRYLEAAGMAVAVADRQIRDDALARTGTLIVGAGTEVVSSRQAAQLLGWVARGGHLMVTASENPGDPLLSRVGVSRLPAFRAGERERICGAAQESLPASKNALPHETGAASHAPKQPAGAARASRKTGPDKRAPGPPEIVLADFPEPLRVDFSQSHVLIECGSHSHERGAVVARSEAFSGPAGVHLVRYGWGDGWITVIADQQIWHNDFIGRHDHALFLEALIDAHRPVLILHGSPVPSLFALIARYGSEAVLAASLFLLAWLVRRGRRFGPLRTIEILQRRALGEHILAASRYRWRHGGAEKLLGGARLAVLARARRCLPGLMDADPAQQSQLLAEHTGLPVELVHGALHADPGRRAPELQTTASSLQSLWIRL